MSTKAASASSLREGSFIVIDGAACKVISTDTSKSGKHGHAKVRMVAVGILDNRKREIVMPAHDNVEVPIIEKKSAQILSVVDGMANVMDEETYETFDLAIPDDLKEGAVPNAKVVYWTILGEKVMKQIKGGD